MNHLPSKGTAPVLPGRAVQGGPADYAALIRRESAKWADIVRFSGATAE
ncbi:hypothetical protein [Polaromonas sp.]|nr:hypothetical protein [Polaromonas sp.]HQS32919.1 hypothetical protein [Polaromonas sp.]HQS92152.1 hypothetical protein [Polaromonas sp.]